MKMRVVFHIDEIEKWKLVITNVVNLCAALNEQEYEIEIVANAAAVKMYMRTGSTIKKELDQLHTAGVRLCACNNALQANHIDPSAIFDYVNVVPAGVKELVERQMDGFAYIKP